MKRFVFIGLLLFITATVRAQVAIDTSRADSVGNQRFMLFKGKYMGKGVFKTNTGKTVTIDPQTKRPKVENSNGSKTELDKFEDKLKESEDEFAEKIRQQIQDGGDGYKLAAAFAKAMEDIEQEKESLKKLNDIIKPFDEDLEDYFNEQKIRQAQQRFDASIDRMCAELDAFYIELKEFLTTHNSRIREFNIQPPPPNDIFASCFPYENRDGKKQERYLEACEAWQKEFLEPKCTEMVVKCLSYLRTFQLLGIEENGQGGFIGFHDDHVGSRSRPKPCYNAIMNILPKLFDAANEIQRYRRHKTWELNKQYGKKYEYIIPVIQTILLVERSCQLLGIGDDLDPFSEILNNISYMQAELQKKRRRRDYRAVAYIPTELQWVRSALFAGASEYNAYQNVDEIFAFPYFKLTIETEFKLGDQSVSDNEEHTLHSGYVLGKMKTETQYIAVYDSTQCIKWFPIEPGNNDEKELLANWKITYGEVLADGKSYKYVSPDENQALAPTIKLNFCGSSGTAQLDVPLPGMVSGVTWTYPMPPPHGPDLFTMLMACFTPMKAEAGNIDKSKIENNAKKMKDLALKVRQGNIRPEEAAKEIQKLNAEMMKQISPSENFMKDMSNVHIEAPFQNFNKTVIDYTFNGKTVSKISGDKLIYANMKIKLEHQPK